MIKIAFVIDSIYTSAGGTEGQLLALIKNLDRAKFAPTLCILRSSAWMDKEFDLCPLYHVGINSFKNPLSILQLAKFARFLKNNRFDIVQTHFNDSNKAGIIAARLAGIPTVISSRRNQGYWHNRFELTALKFLNRHVDLFIANSYSTKQWAIDAEGIPASKITVIYNAVNLERFQNICPEVRANYRSKLGIPQDAFVVGIVANLRPVKRIDIFIRAARRVKEQLPHAKFIVIGGTSDSAMEDKLKGLVAEHGLEGELQFLGIRHDVENLLKTMDVAVLTSESESFSNSVVEYLASGLPVVSTDVGGAREAIVNGNNGYIVPVNDFQEIAAKILAISRDHAMTSRSDKGLQRIKELFSLDTIINQYEELYSSLKLHRGAHSTPAEADSPHRADSHTNKVAFNATIRQFVKASFCAIAGRSFVVSALKKVLGGRVIILTYHRIDDKEDVNGLSVSRTFFAKQLAYLTKMYKVITLEEAVARLAHGNLDETYIVITFDDGYRNTYDIAYPLLKQYKIPATVFITCEAIDKGYYDWIQLDEIIMRLTGDEMDLSGFGLGRLSVKCDLDKKSAIIKLHNKLKKACHQTRREVIDHLSGDCLGQQGRVMMNWEEVKLLAQSGLVTIGAHTVRHPILSKLSPEEASSEIADSKKIIEERTGMTVDFFAYPNGGGADFTTENVIAVQSSGFSAACTTMGGFNRQGDDLFRLQRIDVTYGICRTGAGRFSRSIFAAYVSGVMDQFCKRIRSDEG
jgi:L-malate glycosyltransferase